jgi:hypothetical protein
MLDIHEFLLELVFVSDCGVILPTFSELARPSSGGLLKDVFRSGGVATGVGGSWTTCGGGDTLRSSRALGAD